MTDHIDIAFESFDSHSFAVPIHHFNFDEIDSPEDVIRERIAQGKDVAGFVEAWAKHLAIQQQADVLIALTSTISTAMKPLQRLDEIMFACGMMPGETCQSLGNKHGVKKQAIHRGVKEVIKKFGLRQTRTMRSDKAKRAMAEAYKRRSK